jgi:hypothetical protein
LASAVVRRRRSPRNDRWFEPFASSLNNQVAGMQLARFAAPIVLIATVIALPIAASGDGAPDAFQVAQAGPHASAPGAGNQEIEGQIAELRSRLKITPAQQLQFDALAQVMRLNGRAMNKLLAQQPKGGRPTAVDAVRAGPQFAQANAEGLGRMLPKLEALYGTFGSAEARRGSVFASGPEQEQEQPVPKRR